MFAIRLKELRERAGFSQAVLARKLGVRQSTVGMWENGKNKPQNSKLEMMASIFNVSTDYLLGRSDEPNTDTVEDEIWKMREQIRRDPKRRYLLEFAANGSIEDINRTVAIVDALRQSNGGD